MSDTDFSKSKSKFYEGHSQIPHNNEFTIKHSPRSRALMDEPLKQSPPRDLWEWQPIREDDAVHHWLLQESKEDGTVCWALFESPVTNEETGCVLSSAPFVFASAPVAGD